MNRRPRGLPQAPHAIRHLSAVWCLLGCATGPAFASGFHVDAIGARAAAAAFVATANDPSALFHNPAGAARLQGLNVYGGIGSLLTKTDMDGLDPYPGRGARSRSRDRLLAAPHAFVTRALRDGVVAGVGLTQPFRLATDWFGADEFAGRFLATRLDLEVTTITPTLAIEVLPRLSIGAGLDFSRTTVNWERRVPFVLASSVNGIIDLAEESVSASEDIGVGFSIGVLLDRDRYRFGTVVRSGHDAAATGDAGYTFLGTGNPAIDAELVDVSPDDHPVESVVSLPMTAALGVAWGLGDNLWLSVDAMFTAWSSFDGFSLDHAAEFAELDIGQHVELDDTVEVAVGIDYVAGEKLRLRGGYAFVPTPMGENDVGPLWVDTDRHRVAAGFGYVYEAWTFDVTHALSFHSSPTSRNRDIDFDANYDQTGWAFALSLGYTRF